MCSHVRGGRDGCGTESVSREARADRKLGRRLLSGCRSILTCVSANEINSKFTFVTQITDPRLEEIIFIQVPKLCKKLYAEKV